MGVEFEIALFWEAYLGAKIFLMILWWKYQVFLVINKFTSWFILEYENSGFVMDIYDCSNTYEFLNK
jgi:hypothetical protein